MTKVYIYKLTVDDGGAPCVNDGILSLAICKPAIRSTAKRGNIILGFAANSLYRDNCLVYMARVTENLGGRKYFSDSSRYAGRPDCIYRWDGHRFEWESDSKFHSSSDLDHDLGEGPSYNRAKVILSETPEAFRYFGANCPIDYKTDFPHLKSLVEGLGQGHRVNFDPAVRDELQQFMKRLWSVPSAFRETAIPDTPCRDKCGKSDEDCVTVVC
jgi:putative DNA base modification enzyme with NMAD domain